MNKEEGIGKRNKTENVERHRIIEHKRIWGLGNSLRQKRSRRKDNRVTGKLGYRKPSGNRRTHTNKEAEETEETINTKKPEISSKRQNRPSPESGPEKNTKKGGNREEAQNNKLELSEVDLMKEVREDRGITRSNKELEDSILELVAGNSRDSESLDSFVSVI